MNQAQKDLVAKYPHLFKKVSINIGKGWLPLLEGVCQEMEALRDKSPNIHFTDIKEKFGCLTIYLYGYCTEHSQKCQSIMSRAGEDSSKICEKCGSKDGVITDYHDGNWAKSFCKECSEYVKAHPDERMIPIEDS